MEDDERHVVGVNLDRESVPMKRQVVLVRELLGSVRVISESTTTVIRYSPGSVMTAGRPIRSPAARVTVSSNTTSSFRRIVTVTERSVSVSLVTPRKTPSSDFVRVGDGSPRVADRFTVVLSVGVDGPSAVVQVHPARAVETLATINLRLVGLIDF